MSADASITIFSALIGAVIGSVGSEVVGNILKRRGERAETRLIVVRRYLFQLQDSAEVLLSRLRKHFLSIDFEELSEEGTYMEETTLYAFACFLAYKRVLELEGTYIQMQELGIRQSSIIRSAAVEATESFDALKKILQKKKIEQRKIEQLAILHYYDLVALADSVLERESDYPTVMIFSRFRSTYLLPDVPSLEKYTPSTKGMELFREIFTILRDRYYAAKDLEDGTTNRSREDCEKVIKGTEELKGGVENFNNKLAFLIEILSEVTHVPPQRR
jgi:hypothetical protein